MGRGRQKAKQTKVARELKYYSPNTDYDALQRELGNGPGQPPSRAVPADDAEVDEDAEDEYVDPYADWASDQRH